MWDGHIQNSVKDLKVECFGKIIIASKYFHKTLRVYQFAKIWQSSEYAWDAIMEGYWVFQNSEYARFLHMQVLHKVSSMPKYDWTMLE